MTLTQRVARQVVGTIVAATVLGAGVWVPLLIGGGA